MFVGDKELIKELIANQSELMAVVMYENDLGIAFMRDSFLLFGNPKLQAYFVSQKGIGLSIEEKLREYQFETLENMDLFLKQIVDISPLGMLFVLGGNLSICLNDNVESDLPLIEVTPKS